MPAYPRKPGIQEPSVFDSPVTRGLKRVGTFLGADDPDSMLPPIPAAFGEAQLSGPAKALFQHLRRWTIDAAQKVKGPVDPALGLGARITGRYVPAAKEIKVPEGFEFPGRDLKIRRAPEMVKRRKETSEIFKRSKENIDLGVNPQTIRSFDELRDITVKPPASPTRKPLLRDTEGRKPRGGPRKRLSEENVRAIRGLYKAGKSQSEILQQYPMHEDAMRKILHGQAWKGLKD